MALTSSGRLWYTTIIVVSLAEVVKVLENNQLFIAPEKVQMGKRGEYLGTKITPHSISPQKSFMFLLSLFNKNLKSLELQLVMWY